MSTDTPRKPPITEDAPAPAQDGVEEGWLYEVAVKGGTYRTEFSCSKPTDWRARNTRQVFSGAASPPLQPTPPAQPVIGELFAFKVQLGLGEFWEARIRTVTGSEFIGASQYDTEAEALAFIESCRPAQPNGVPTGEADRRDERDEFEKDEGYTDEDLTRDDQCQGYINPETQYIYQIWRDGYRAAIAQQKKETK